MKDGDTAVTDPSRSEAGKAHHRKRAAKRQRARQRALRLLAEHHSIEFEELLAIEYEIEGFERHAPEPKPLWSRFDD